MYDKKYDETGYESWEACGTITCIHCVDGYCSSKGNCDLYERSLKQED